MNNFDLIKVNMFRMTPKHSHYEVVGCRNWLVNVFKVHIQKILSEINKNISLKIYKATSRNEKQNLK